MINWILGGLIVVATLYIIFRTVNKIRKGKDICGCDGCNAAQCGCSSKKC
ncbi:MAG: FeoB-associated Cys-rich membrane protein [Clostridia bacterium]|nr:FeoB-associated Cys-rich membrane protein [Clostridia bacterium]